MKMTFPFQMQNVVFIFQTKSRCRNSQRDFRHLNLRDTFNPRLPTLDSDNKIDFRQCRNVGSFDTSVGTPSHGWILGCMQPNQLDILV